MITRNPDGRLLRLVGPLCVTLSLMAGCVTTSPDRLPPLDRRFYENLSSEELRTEFLLLRPSQRQAFLEEKGLWDEWKKLTAVEREGVDRGEVEVGFLVFAARMAWGRPADIKVVEVGNRKVAYEVFIRCTSGPRAGQHVRQSMECDGTSSERQIAVENGIVVEVRFLD
ncbi:MAG: hypothetical protein ACPHRO_10485 [Nannocystaceae bacterium]